MVGDILLAGYTITEDDWRALDPEIREELSNAVSGRVEIDLGTEEDMRTGRILVS